MHNLPFETKKRKILCKDKEFKVNKKTPKYSVDDLFKCGVIVLDKPKKYYCKQIDNKLVHALEVPRVGHAGTLDPLVEGVLPILLAKATKFSEILSNAGKVYDCIMHIHDDVDEKKVKKVLKSFEGKIKQFPPKKSAVKRQWRTREIYGIKFISMNRRDVIFRVWCEAGTYIRTLCVDVGEELGIGAHMLSLRRIQVANLKIDDAIGFFKLTADYHDYLKTKKEDLIKKIILPKEKALSHLPRVWVDNNIKERLKNGSPIFAPGILALDSKIEKGENVAVLSEDNELWVVGKAEMNSTEMLKKSKGMAVKTFMVLI